MWPAAVIAVQAAAEQASCVSLTTLGTSFRNRYWDIPPRGPCWSPWSQHKGHDCALSFQTIAPDFSIFSLVQNMRTQRPSLVQTKVAFKDRQTNKRKRTSYSRHKQHNYISDIVLTSTNAVWCVFRPRGQVTWSKCLCCLIVQPQEQYQLVYTTIKLLFEQHLQDMDAQARRSVVSGREHRQAITMKHFKMLHFLFQIG